ncbi:hypothetical protein IAD21_06456 (plasmid) [Abditibacteriota bacterium]|nr:hypothetical protein IAD21_06456 [Abditibacteriota bacterium]
MSRHGLPVPPAPAIWDELFEPVPDYRGDQSHCGQVRCQQWGEVAGYCKVDGTLLIPRREDQVLAWLSPLPGNFHTGHSFPSGYAALHRCHAYLDALTRALDNDHFYRLLPARDRLVEQKELTAQDVLLWRLNSLFLRRGARIVRLPLEASWWPDAITTHSLTNQSSIRAWATGSTTPVRAVLQSADGQRALAKALTGVSLSHDQEFWSCVTCPRVEVVTVREALEALSRLQQLGWWTGRQHSWHLCVAEKTTGFNETFPLRCLDDNTTAHMVDGLLQQVEARFTPSAFLGVTTPNTATTPLLFAPNTRPRWFPLSNHEEQAPHLGTAHEHMEALCTWNTLANQLNSPAVPRINGSSPA